MEKDPSQPFLVVGDILQDFGYIDRKGFRLVKCQRQEAYGCGPNGDAIVRGLALFVCLGLEEYPYESARLSLSASDEVFNLVGSEIDDHKAELYGRDLRCSCRVCTVDRNVMVLRVSFIASFSMTDFRTYYLVYDSTAASLSLLPCLPPSCRLVCSESPLVLKVGEEGDKYSQLVLMAERSVRPSAKYTHPVLCLWSPPPPSPDDNRRDYSRRAWELNGRVGANNAFHNPFQANVVFVFKRYAVWGDLAQGIMYCHCNHLIDGAEPVDFKHIMLPRECRISSEDLDVMDHCSLDVHRTMGCVGDSIWFVIIEPNFTCPGDTTVKVWTLNLLRDEEEKWNPHREFNMLEVFFRAGRGLPQAVPRFPMVRRHQTYCAFYMLLPQPYTGGTSYSHLVCIDLSSSYEVRLGSNTRMAVTPIMNRPVILDRDFFSWLGH